MSESVECIYEDEDIIAVNKPAGLLVHPLKNSKFQIPNSQKEPTLVDWLLARYPEIKMVGDPVKSRSERDHGAGPVKLPDGSHGASDPLRPGIVHRLDRDTSGVMVVARTQEAFNHLKSLFAGRKIRKTYLAWVFGKLKEREGVITRPIGIVSGSTRRSTRSGKMAKDAVTRYKVEKEIMKNGEPFSLLKVSPETGRTHQIRVHCASIGHPIVGDALYTRRKSPAGHERLMLHAFLIELPLLSGSMMRFEAEPPGEFANFAREF